eukprot:TRINITY_DN2076_c0_g1_i1.p1 TRINITY_DN2076_c0_g1~~TRINITY_DN2076_c0_g1_i1.p1  ORF type:complete len:118 (-),score=19.96 TRINITY_DN2076_c0_g1_i1:213-566(-)
MTDHLPSQAILKDPFVMSLMAENEKLRNELTELRERLHDLNALNGEEERNGGNHRKRSKHTHNNRSEDVEEEDNEAVSAAVSCVAALFDKVPTLRKFAPQPYYALSSTSNNRSKSRT